MLFCISYYKERKKKNHPVHRGKILAVTTVPADAGIQTLTALFPDFISTVD